jgi:hypothetical protein
VMGRGSPLREASPKDSHRLLLTLDHEIHVHLPLCQAASQMMLPALLWQASAWRAESTDVDGRPDDRGGGESGAPADVQQYRGADKVGHVR